MRFRKATWVVYLILFALVSLLMLNSCEKQSNAQSWQIGKGQPMDKTLLELEAPKNIRFCSEEYKHISFPLILHVIYDDKKYYGLLEGVCITVHAKVLRVKFANPSSGKVARGTFEILGS